MSEFRTGFAFTACFGCLGGPHTHQTGPRQSRLPIYIYLFAAARPQSSDTEGAPTRGPARGLLLLSAPRWFPGYSIGSRRVRAAIKEPSQP